MVKEHTKLFVIGKFNDDLVESFVSFLNDHSGPKHLVIDSVGGNLDAMNLILSIINNDPDQYKITAFSNVGSCSFDFLLRARCERVVLDSALAIVHLAGRDLHTKELKNPHSFDYWVKDLEEKYGEELLIFYSGYLNKDELELVKHGKEVFLTAERLRTMLNIK